MVAIQNLGKSFGARTLFSGVNLDLRRGGRYGLVGANGCGKTTLLRIIAGEEPASEGTLVFPKQTKLGVLKQDRFLADDERVIQAAMRGDREVFDALAEQSLLATGVATTAERIAELDEFIRSRGGWTLEARSSEVLVGLGIPTASHSLPLSALSGGFKLRVLLAQVLVSQPDLMLLDEPTNHLDILSIRWLEKFLSSYEGCAIIISHDRRFLDNVSTHILDVDYGTVTHYVGSYTQFEAQKVAVRERKETEIARQQKIVADKMAFVERFRYKATKARQAQSRVKQIEKIEVEELPRSTRRYPQFRFEPRRASGVDVVKIDGICKAYGEHQVLNGVSLSVRRRDRVGIIGPNGIGKSTLLKILVDRLSADAGRIEWGHETRVGYFSQDHRDQIGSGNVTLLDWLWTFCSTETEGFVRSQLGKVLFSGDDVLATSDTLSGGESARLLFCRLMVEQPNVLVLDEPTNHLDIEATEALCATLKQFDGTVLFVSHDRWFVSELATRIVELTPAGYQDFPGTFEEYLDKCGDDHLDADRVASRAKAEQRSKGLEADGERAAVMLQRDELKRKRNRLKGLPAKRDQALTKVEGLERKIKEFELQYEDPEFFVRTPPSELQVLQLDQQRLQGELNQALAEWETLEAEIAALGSELAGLAPELSE
jgi:ATPase subunit of ABC transporter with duplicated ATPase domains